MRKKCFFTPCEERKKPRPAHQFAEKRQTVRALRLRLCRGLRRAAADAFGRREPREPSRREVVTARHPVDVEHLARKESPGTCLLSIVLGDTDDRLTPPHVTNSP